MTNKTKLPAPGQASLHMTLLSTVGGKGLHSPPGAVGRQTQCRAVFRGAVAFAMAFAGHFFATVGQRARGSVVASHCKAAGPAPKERGERGRAAHEGVTHELLERILRRLARG